MANSYIKLYYSSQWRLIKNKLMVIEDIEKYLSSFDFLAISNYQYVKHDVAITLKFDLSQRYTDNLINDGIKYVSITNNDTNNTFYYYVDNAEWRARECVRLTLSLDILNTFKYGTDYILSDKTKINRQHKNRFEFLSGDIYKRIIDVSNENINPILYKQEESYINGDGLKWYLLYINDSEPSESLVNPVKCLLCANREIDVKPFGTEANGRIYPNMLVDGYFYYSLMADNTFTLDDGTTINTIGNSISNIQIYKLNEYLINVVVVTKIVANLDTTYYKRVYTTSYLQISSNQSFDYTNVNTWNTSPTYEKPTEYIGTQQFYVAGYPVVRLSSIDDLDRTNAKLIRVIELPYCVDDFTYTNNVLQVNSNWLYVVNDGFSCLQLANLNTKFKSTIEFVDNPINNCFVTSSEINTNPTAQRDDNLESKIYNSEFYNVKFVYDSFVFTFDLEKLNITSIDDITMTNFNFYASNTITGKFMFKFDNYKLKVSTSDYDNILVVNRNNDLALYNVSYINYIRNGYNYDVKNKTRTQESAGINTSLSLLGTIGAFASSYFSGGFGIAMGVSMATSTISQIYNTIQTIKTTDESLAEKINQLKNQSASVSGSDDIDLLNVYTNENKAKLCYYAPSTQMTNALLDLFYYCGYADNVQEKPNITTRTRFNYLMADIDLAYTCNLSATIIEQLKTLYANGVTFIHNYNNAWDVEQITNNIETNIGG